MHEVREHVTSRYLLVETALFVAATTSRLRIVHLEEKFFYHLLLSLHHTLVFIFNLANLTEAQRNHTRPPW
jgi:hypothetical protein